MRLIASCPSGDTERATVRSFHPQWAVFRFCPQRIFVVDIFLWKKKTTFVFQLSVSIFFYHIHLFSSSASSYNLFLIHIHHLFTVMCNF